MSRFVRPGDDPDAPRSRLELRFRQLDLTVLVVLFTAWICTLGPLPAIISLLIAKHVLVCILMLKLDRDAAHSPDR